MRLTHGYSLDWSEIESSLADRWVDEEVEDGNEDDERDRVEVVDQVVRHTIQLHRGGHGSQIADHLIVSQPVKGQPGEDFAGVETTSDLVDPCIVDASEEFGGVVSQTAGLDSLPKVVALEVLDRLERVCGPATLAGEAEGFEGFREDRLGWWLELVESLAADEDDGSNKEQERRQRISKPKSNVSLSVDHSNRSGERSEVDHQVEVQEDTRVRDLRIANHTLSALGDDDLWASLRNLFGKQRGDVGLETPSSDSHDDETDCEASESALRVIHNRGNRADDENGVSDDGGEDTPLDGSITAKVCVCDVSTEERHHVCPKLVEGLRAPVR